MNMHVICHARHRNHKLVKQVALEYSGTVQHTEYARHAESIANKVPVDTSVLGVAGGDGTLHEVVNGLMSRPAEHRPPILLIPLGSGNDTARMIGAKATVADVQRRMAYPKIHDWDVLECAVGETQQIHYCINVLDAGFGGDVAQRYAGKLRKLPSRLGYIAATLQSFVTAEAQHMTVTTESGKHGQAMLLAAVANSKWFGSGIGIAPHAKPNDGILDITLVKNVGPITYTRFLPQLMAGKPIDDTRIQYLSGRTCDITSHKPLPIEIDGEFVGYTPLRVRVHPNAVRLLV